MSANPPIPSDTIKILLQLLLIIGQAAPLILKQVDAIRAQTGQTDEEILIDMGVTADRAEAKGIALTLRIQADQAAAPPATL